MREWFRSVVSVGLFMTLSAGSAAWGEPGDGLAQVISQARRATVGILEPVPDNVIEGGPKIRGTGFHLWDRYVVTARHAVERREGSRTVIPRTIAVLTENFDELPAELVGFSEFVDLALYRLTAETPDGLLASLPFGEREPSPGEEVFTVGYPLGWGPTLGFGRVGNPNTFLSTVQSRLLQLDLAVCSGNSGGGLFNERGEVVGILHAIIQTEGLQAERRCSRLAFALPGRLARRIVAALIEGAPTQFPWLGAQLTALKTGTTWRVAIAEVTGPARDAGLQKGDVLLAVGELEVTSAAQLKSFLLEETRPGERVAIRVLRGGQEEIVYVTLGGS